MPLSNNNGRSALCLRVIRMSVCPSVRPADRPSFRYHIFRVRRFVLRY